MIEAVIFDMFETLVSIFSGDTYFSEHIASDLNIPVEVFRPVWHSTERGRSSGLYTIQEAVKISLEKLGCYSEEKVQLIVDHRRKNLEGVFARTPKETIELLQARYFDHLAYEPHIPCDRLDGFDHAKTQMDVLKYI